jgi:hypothetical protein
MEYGLTLKSRVDAVLRQIGTLPVTTRAEGERLQQIERRLQTLSSEIYNQPGEMIGGDFRAHFDETLASVTRELAGIRGGSR